MGLSVATGMSARVCLLERPRRLAKPERLLQQQGASSYSLWDKTQFPHGSAEDGTSHNPMQVPRDVRKTRATST